MRHRHRRGAHFRFTVYFGIMLIYYFFVGTCKEHTAHREPADIFRFFNTCFLQEWETVASSTYKDEVAHVILRFTGIVVFHSHLPLVVLQLLKIFHTMVIIHFDIL